MRKDFVTELQKLKDTSAGLLFLYPLLQLDKKIQPIGVYLGIKDVDMEEPLVCLFHESQPEFNKWLSDMKNHKLYLTHYIEDGYYYVIFELMEHESCYNQILNGDYSNIRNDYKIIIGQSNNVLTNIALYPDEYYEDIAYDLEVDPDILKGEQLIPPPTYEKDYIFVSKSLKEKMMAEMY
jgi:hypothetical protein